MPKKSENPAYKTGQSPSGWDPTTTKTVLAATPATSASVELFGIGGVCYVKITNDTAGPTLAATIYVETSPDDSNFYRWKSKDGNTDNDGIESEMFLIPFGVKFVRAYVAGNTVESVFAEFVVEDAYTPEY
jgi:hypothetical protein